MANNEVIKLTLDIQAKVGDLESEVAKMQKSFSKLSAPATLTKDIKDAFDDLDKRLNEVKQRTQNNELKLVDEKKVQAELRAIEKDYDVLTRKISNNQSKFSLAKASKEAVSLKQAIEDYNTEIGKGTQKVQDQLKKVQELNDKIARAQNDIATATQVRQNAEQDLKVLEQEEKQLKAVVDQIRAQKQAQYGSSRSTAQIESYVMRTKEGQQYTKVLQDIANAKQNLANATTNYNSVQTRANNTIATAQVNLTNAQATLQQYQNDLNNLKVTKLDDIKNTLAQIAQNNNLNFGFDISKIQSIDQLEQELSKIEQKDLSQVTTALAAMLAAAQQGQKGIQGMGDAIDQASNETKQFNSELDQIKNRITHFFGLANAVNLFRRAVRSAYETVKDLDKVMTETAVVTSFDVGDMWEQLPEYTERANQLGVSIHDAYEAATLYYQQGLKTNEVMAVSNETLKMARIAGLGAAESTDRMTNALRGFNMAITEANAQNINDVYSNLAAKTASNVDEISTAMTKVASLANNANMSFENTAAFLSQIIETTRESAETAGTALKTVIARFSEVKNLYSEGELLGELEGEEIDVNKVSKALRTAGINLNEYLTGMKGLDDIFMELSSKWDTLDQVQQRYIATMAAGSRQQSRFIALMQDYSRMTELVSEANNATGASQGQFEKTLESLQTKLNQLKNAWNTFLMGIADNEAIKFLIDTLTNLISTINKVLSGLNGVPKSLASIAVAIGGFKLGKSIFNKLLGNIKKSLGLQELVKKLTGDLGQGIKKNSGNIASGIAGSLRNSLGKLKGSSAWADFRNAFGKQLSNNMRFSIESVDLNSMTQASINKLSTSFRAQLKTMNLGSAAKPIAKMIDGTAEGLQKAQVEVQKLGKSFTGYTDSLSKTDKKTVEAQANLGKMTATLTATGAAVLLVGTILDKVLGKDMKWLTNGIKALGISLMVIPNILKAIEASGVAAGINIQAAFGWISIVLAAIVGIGVALASLAKQNSPAEKLKRAQEAAQAAADAANEAAEAYKNLGDSFDELGDKYKKLEDLIEGTQEWREAVFEINQQVLELIKNYPALSDLVTNKNGVLKIDLNSAAVQGVMNDYFKQSVEASSIAAAMQIRALQQRNESNYDTLRNVGFENGRILYARAKYKSSYGGSYYDDRQLTEDIAKQIATGKLLTSSEIANYAESFGASIDTTEKSIEALRAFGNALIEAEKQTNSFATSMALDAIQLAGIEGENSTYASEFLGTGVINEINKRISNEVEDKASAFIGANSLKYDTKYKDFWQKRYGSVTIDRYGKVSYYDSEKGQQTIDAELARQEYAAAKATEEMADAAEKFVNIISKAETSQEIKNLFGDKEGRALTQADINKWASSSGTVHGGGGADGKAPFQKAMEDLYRSIYGDQADLNSEEFKAFLDKASTDLEIAQKRWEKATVSINNVLGEVPTKVETMTTGQAEGIGKVLSETMLVNGKAAAIKMWDLISQVGEDQTSKLAEAFSFIDFNNIDSIEDLEGILEDLNLSSLATEDGFKDLKAMLLDVAKASQQVDLQKVKKAIEELSSIRAKFLKGEATRTWSKEEFELMQSYLSQDILKDFVEDEDGNYIYLGDRMDDLRKAIEDNTFALRGEEITSLENQARARDILKQGTANWGLNQWQYGTIEGITNAQGLSLEARQQIFEQYLKQLQEQLTPEQLKTLGLGISKETNLQDIIDEGKFETYWEKFINLANNAALDAQIEQLEKDKAVTALSGITNNAEVARKGTEAALGQLQVRAIKAGMNDEIYGQYDMNNISELASMVTAYQEAQNLGIDIAKLEEYAALLRDTNKNLEDNITLSTQVALANTKLNTGLSEIISSYKDWTELIDETGKIKATTSDEAETFNKLKKSVNEMLNTSEDLSDAFWDNKTNIELIKEAAEGSVEAIGKLQKIAAADYALNLVPEKEVNKTEAEIESLLTQISNLILTTDLPKLEPGIELKGYDQFIEELGNLMIAAGYSVDQINKQFESLGFSVEWGETSDTTESEYTIFEQPEEFDAAHGRIKPPKFTKVKMPTTVSTPYIKSIKAISNGSGGGGVSTPNITAGKSNKPSSSSSSSGSSSKPSYWKNPYDELYNLNEKINESLRKRQALERQYQKLIKSDASTIGDIRKAYRDQIAMMQQQINLQRQLAQGRLNQINNLANQYYTDSEGRRRTYASMGVTRYAHYNTETGEITIDWDALEAIANDANRSEEGAAAEAYINALQELVSSYEETRDAIWEIEDAIEDLNKELVQSYLSFEDRVLDALVASYEREIDSLEKINDTINDATSKMLDSMREQIDTQRQERENAKTEEEIARMEARLAYLRQDTSGANSLEIMQLEKELEDARQNYEDSLIDQALEQMQKDADLAAEQRAQQIEVMRAQLDMAVANGELWDEVYDLLLGAWDENGHIRLDSRLYELLSAADGTAAMSEVGKLEWWTEYVQSLNSFVGDIQGVYAQYGDQLSDELLQILQAIGGIREDIVTNTPTVPVGSGNTGGNNGGSGNSGNGNNGGNTPTIPRPKISQTSGVLQLGDYNDNVLLLRQALVGLGIRDFAGWPITDAAHTLEPKRFDEQLEQGVINFQRSFNWGGAIDADGKVGSNTRKKFKRAGYKTGGLADFTGPAWLDGTRTHPELVLNARDTENFISLKNILAGLMTPEANNGTFGKNDTYIDIDINADIGSDYDVQQLANEVKRQIVRDANYRNVNTINFMR